MALANWEEGNHHLDQTKLRFTDDADATPEAESAERYIKAKLEEQFPDAIFDWGIEAGDTAPPEIIQEIAGMLMAAKRYEKVYSEETVAESDYAARLYVRADKLLEDIKNGAIVIIGVTPPNVEFSKADFWPNDTDVVIEHTPLSAKEMEPNRRFTMDTDL
jgi:hypothetical protein